MAAPQLARRRGSGARRSPAASVVSHIDLLLVITVVGVAIMGCVMVFSVTRGNAESPTTFFLERQTMFVIVGVALMAGTAAIDYRHLRDWSVPLAGGLLFLLAVVLSPLGSESKGTQAWFEFANFQLQPSEIAKPILIVGLASFLTFERAELDGRRLTLVFGLAALPMGLIMLQPDVGTVLVFGAITLGMVAVAGARPRHFAILALVAIVGSVGVLNSGLLAEYQTDRLTSFVNLGDASDSAYNQTQSQIAIGAGGVHGQGLFEGTQTGLDFVPEQHTDFIFTVVGEELGFVGGSLLLAAYGLIVWRIWRTAQLARDEFGMLVCAGVLALFVFQVFQSVGMAMGIMPVTGIPLPFLSYGGSSTLTAFIAMGLVLSVHMRRFT